MSPKLEDRIDRLFEDKPYLLEELSTIQRRIANNRLDAFLSNEGIDTAKYFGVGIEELQIAFSNRIKEILDEKNLKQIIKEQLESLADFSLLRFIPLDDELTDKDFITELYVEPKILTKIKKIKPDLDAKIHHTIDSGPRISLAHLKNKDNFKEVSENTVKILELITDVEKDFTDEELDCSILDFLSDDINNHELYSAKLRSERNLVLDQKLCLVIGDVGAGKSSLLRCFLKQNANGYYASYKRFPVCVHARDFLKKIKEDFPHDMPRDFFIEGLDECRTSDQISEILNIISKDDSEDRFVVMTRDIAELNQVKQDYCYSINIQDFSSEQKRKMIKNYYIFESRDNYDLDKELSLIFEQVESNQAISELTNTPAVLACFIMYLKNEIYRGKNLEDLFSNIEIHSIYKNALDYVFNKHDTLKTERRNVRYRNISADMSILNKVAYEHLLNSSNNLLGVVKSISVEKVDDIVNEIIESKLVWETGSGFEFFHLSYREYLAARHFIDLDSNPLPSNQTSFEKRHLLNQSLKAGELEILKIRNTRPDLFYSDTFQQTLKFYFSMRRNDNDIQSFMEKLAYLDNVSILYSDKDNLSADYISDRTRNDSFIKVISFFDYLPDNVDISAKFRDKIAKILQTRNKDVGQDYMDMADDIASKSYRLSILILEDLWAADRYKESRRDLLLEILDIHGDLLYPQIKSQMISDNESNRNKIIEKILECDNPGSLVDLVLEYLPDIEKADKETVHRVAKNKYHRNKVFDQKTLEYIKAACLKNPEFILGIGYRALKYLENDYLIERLKDIVASKLDNLDKKQNPEEAFMNALEHLIRNVEADNLNAVNDILEIYSKYVDKVQGKGKLSSPFSGFYFNFSTRSDCLSRILERYSDKDGVYDFVYNEAQRLAYIKKGQHGPEYDESELKFLLNLLKHKDKHKGYLSFAMKKFQDFFSKYERIIHSEPYSFSTSLIQYYQEDPNDPDRKNLIEMLDSFLLKKFYISGSLWSGDPEEPDPDPEWLVLEEYLSAMQKTLSKNEFQVIYLRFIDNYKDKFQVLRELIYRFELGERIEDDNEISEIARKYLDSEQHKKFHSVISYKDPDLYILWDEFLVNTDLISQLENFSNMESHEIAHSLDSLRQIILKALSKITSESLNADYKKIINNLKKDSHIRKRAIEKVRDERTKIMNLVISLCQFLRKADEDIISQVLDSENFQFYNKKALVSSLFNSDEYKGDVDIYLKTLLSHYTGEDKLSIRNNNVPEYLREPQNILEFIGPNDLSFKRDIQDKYSLRLDIYNFKDQVNQLINEGNVEVAYNLCVEMTRYLDYACKDDNLAVKFLRAIEIHPDEIINSLKKFNDLSKSSAEYLKAYLKRDDPSKEELEEYLSGVNIIIEPATEKETLDQARDLVKRDFHYRDEDEYGKAYFKQDENRDNEKHFNFYIEHDAVKIQVAACVGVEDVNKTDKFVYTFGVDPCLHSMRIGEKALLKMFDYFAKQGVKNVHAHAPINKHNTKLYLNTLAGKITGITNKDSDFYRFKISWQLDSIENKTDSPSANIKSIKLDDLDSDNLDLSLSRLIANQSELELILPQERDIGKDKDMLDKQHNCLDLLLKDGYEIVKRLDEGREDYIRYYLIKALNE